MYRLLLWIFSPLSYSSSQMLQENQQYKKTPTQHTQQPYVTGTSVLGIRFKDGVMLAADTLGIYYIDYSFIWITRSNQRYETFGIFW